MTYLLAAARPLSIAEIEPAPTGIGHATTKVLVERGFRVFVSLNLHNQGCAIAHDYIVCDMTKSLPISVSSFRRSTAGELSPKFRTDGSSQYSMHNVLICSALRKTMEVGADDARGFGQGW